MTAMPRFSATFTDSAMAVSCGIPTPETTRVVQMDPPPMPTFTASTPARISASVPSAVATLPAISGTRGNARFNSVTASTTDLA